MKKIIDFVKENIGIIGKLLVNHIAISIFSIVVLVAAKGINNVLFHIAGVFAIIFYLFLLYLPLWEVGAKDKIKAEAGRIEKNKLFGFYVSAAYNAIFILFALIIFILSFFTGKSEIADGIYGVLKILMHYGCGMYLSVTSTVQNASAGINFDAIYLIIMIPSLVCCLLSYLSGLSGMKCLIPEKKKKKK